MKENEEQKEVRMLYSVTIGNFDPLKKESIRALEFVSKLEGLVGVHPEYPRGTFLFFDTLNQAKRGRNRLQAVGIKTGTNIMRCESDDQLSFVEVKEVADL